MSRAPYSVSSSVTRLSALAESFGGPVALRHRISPVLPLSELGLILIVFYYKLPGFFLYNQIFPAYTAAHTANAEKWHNYQPPGKTGYYW